MTDMKKIMVLLLFVAVAINAMAIDFTAKAKVTLTASSGFSCNLRLSEYPEAGALSGSEINMDGRKVALYALNGGTKLQIVQATTITNLPLGLLTDASTDYTLSVSEVEGSETMKIYDKETGLYYNLTEGASYNFTATANTTNEDRFVLNYVAPVVPEFEICFRDNQLQITANPYAENVVVKDANDTKVVDVAPVTPYQAIDLSALAAGRYTVELADGARKFIIVKQ